jgi:hypothetical protein
MERYTSEACVDAFRYVAMPIQKSTCPSLYPDRQYCTDSAKANGRASRGDRIAALRRENRMVVLDSSYRSDRGRYQPEYGVARGRPIYPSVPVSDSRLRWSNIEGGLSPDGKKKYYFGELKKERSGFVG